MTFEQRRPSDVQTSRNEAMAKLQIEDNWNEVRSHGAPFFRPRGERGAGARKRGSPKRSHPNPDRGASAASGEASEGVA